MCAIDLGLPDVVETLVMQGADVEQRALTDSQSPLYYLVSRLSGRVNPTRMLVTLTARMMQEPDLVLQDTLRRFGVGVAGAFGSNSAALRSHQELAVAVPRHWLTSTCQGNPFQVDANRRNTSGRRSQPECISQIPCSWPNSADAGGRKRLARAV
jgi:hypothetical protein